MSSTVQISLNTEREKQIGELRKKHRKLAYLGTTEIAKSLFFQKLDEMLEKAGDKK